MREAAERRRRAAQGAAQPARRQRAATRRHRVDTTVPIPIIFRLNFVIFYKCIIVLKAARGGETLGAGVVSHFIL